MCKYTRWSIREKNDHTIKYHRLSVSLSPYVTFPTKNSWLERLSLSVRIGIFWFLVEKAQFHIHNIHHSQREEKRNFTFKPKDMEYNGNRKPDITPDTTYIQATKLHTQLCSKRKTESKKFLRKAFRPFKLQIRLWKLWLDLRCHCHHVFISENVNTRMLWIWFMCTVWHGYGFTLYLSPSPSQSYGPPPKIISCII